MDPTQAQQIVTELAQPHPVTAFVRSIVDLGPYTMFIVVAYTVTFTVTALLIAYALIDESAQRRALAALEARGIRRRSDTEQKAAQS